MIRIGYINNIKTIMSKTMSQRKEMLMKNMEFVAYEGLNGKPGFQMTLHKSKEDRYYLYVACFRHNGFNIIDVTDPYLSTFILKQDLKK